MANGIELIRSSPNLLGQVLQINELGGGDALSELGD
jgi:hypothetical protein